MSSQPPGSAIRLRQIAFLAKDLARAQHLLTTVLGTEVIYRDPNVALWGLENILVPIGGDIIEVCAPFREDVSGSRRLAKRGDGGYMIIMQTDNAADRREYIESRKLASVAFRHSEDEFECVQYHPKGIPGGMMPELDTQKLQSGYPTYLESPASPWFPCGQDYAQYSAAMSRTAHLQIMNVVCRLAPGQQDTTAAARKWEDIFGARCEGSQLIFTNTRLQFVGNPGSESEELLSIEIGIHGRERYSEVLQMAQNENVVRDGRVFMLGVEWTFTLLDGNSDSEARSRL